MLQHVAQRRIVRAVGDDAWRDSEGLRARLPETVEDGLCQRSAPPTTLKGRPAAV